MRDPAGALEGSSLRSQQPLHPKAQQPPATEGRRPWTLDAASLTSPTLGANTFPEVTRLFCRLPLPTLFYRLEASCLGDRMR